MEPVEAVTVDDAIHGEERFRAASIEYASDVVWFLDVEGRILWTSPGIKRVLGYEPEELTGRLGSDICHPDDYERVFEQFITFLADRSREALRTESRSRHKNGSWIW